jgi:hypothetical protein
MASGLHLNTNEATAKVSWEKEDIILRIFNCRDDFLLSKSQLSFL